MQLDKLILVRHGSYDRETADLDPEGVEQVTYLGNALKAHIVPGSTVIYSSPIERALQSAQILSQILSLEVVEAFQLGPRGAMTEPHAVEVMELIGSKPAKVVILVTHEPLACAFPKHFGEKIDASFGLMSVDQGCASVIDCTSQRLCPLG